MGILFTLLVIHGHGELWWNDTNGIISDSSTRALWQSYQQSSSSRAGETSKGDNECSIQNILSYFVGFFNMLYYDMGLTPLLPF
jgi:hypothetical protein